MLLWAAFRAFPIAFVLSRAALLAGILGYLHYHDGPLVLDPTHRALVEKTPDVAVPISNTTIVLIVAIGIALNLLTRMH